MTLRIELLSAHRPELRQMTGAVLAAHPDAVLQRIVAELGEHLHAPIATVALVLERIALFRAHVGLPAELAATRAVERSGSLCQLVTRTGTLTEITDLPAAVDAPQELHVRYGIVAYLGAPVLLGGRVVGALAVFDRIARTFTDEHRARIVELAAEVGDRLDELSNEEAPSPSALHDRAVRPQFAELRNRLQPLVSGVGAMQVAVAELQATHRVAEYVAQHPEEPGSIVPLESAAEALRDLEEVLAEVASNVTQVHRAVVALESASLVAGAGSTVIEIIESASTLAHHQTKLLGGVRWTTPIPAVPVLAPLSVAVNALAAALSMLSSDVYRVRGKRGLAGAVIEEPAILRIRIEAADLDPATLLATASSLSQLVGAEPSVLVMAPGDSSLELALTRT